MARNILFVCTGNSCRSVMAQGLLQQQLKPLAHRLRQPVEVDSAGVSAFDGMSPSREALTLLQRAGIDLSGHMAKSLTDEMIRRADLIFVMEPFHVDEVVRRAPDAKAKTHLLRRYGVPAHDAAAVEAGIADPIGRSMDVYERCFAVIREAVGRVANSLVAEAP